MTSKQSEAQATVPQWKQALLEANQLLAHGRKAAFNIARLLVAVYDDAEFLGSIGSEEEATDVLDGYAVHLFVIRPEGRSPFLDLRAMLDQFPEASQWESGDLSTMYETIVADAVKPNDEKPQPTRRTATLADIERLERELSEAKYRIGELERENDALRQLAATPESILV